MVGHVDLNDYHLPAFSLESVVAGDAYVAVCGASQMSVSAGYDRHTSDREVLTGC